MAEWMQGRGSAKNSTAIVVLSLLATVESVFAESTYSVGDAAGWGTGNNYRSWEQNYTFEIGDTIVFKYSPPHSVLQVSQADYQACSTSSPLKSSSSGSDSITIKDPSTFFICGTPGHCQMGMKVAILTATSTTPSTPISPPSGSSGSSKTPTAAPHKSSAISLQSGAAIVILLSAVAAITPFAL